MFCFAKSKKFRVIVGPANFYATAHEIRNGVGTDYRCNAALQKALLSLEFTRSGTGIAEQSASGIAGVWEDMNVQLDMQ